MSLPLNLNRRHKVTLFLTVLLAGITALDGAKMMQVVGILLLGVALAWAFGSDSRVVHWLFVSAGVFLACGTVGGTWYIHQSDTNLYEEKVAAFEHRIPELAREYPLHKNGQIILDKDLEPYFVKNPKAGLPAFDPRTAKPFLRSHKPSEASGKTISPPVTEWDAQGRPISEPSLDYDALAAARHPGAVQSTTRSPAALPADFFSLFQLMMPDGHIRYFENKRDADNCQEGFFERKTQKMWNEAWVASLDLCAFTITDVAFNDLPGYPPKPLWGLISEPFIGGVAVAVWQVMVFGVILFALGLGLILGIRAKPLPT